MACRNAHRMVVELVQRAGADSVDLPESLSALFERRVIFFPRTPER